MWSSPHGSPLTAALDVSIIGAMSEKQSSIGEWEIPEFTVADRFRKARENDGYTAGARVDDLIAAASGRHYGKAA